MVNKRKRKRYTVILFGISALFTQAETKSRLSYQEPDTTKKHTCTTQKDIVDVLRETKLFRKQLKKDTLPPLAGKIYPSLFPAVGYTITTGVTFILASNLSFYTAKPDSTNLSVISLNPLYSIQQQIIVPLISSIWFKNNNINLLGDYRYYKYPSVTYGLGSRTLPSNVDSIDYSYISISQEALYHVGHSLYAGAGYSLDYHYNITDEGNQPDFGEYMQGARQSISSGVLVHLKYDSRTNINNPASAFYGSLTYRDNLTVLGSDNNWQSVQLDFRKYLNIFPHHHSILALWNWDVISLGNKVPYLDLPSTGWDTYSNSGRGYIQGRFRGTDMIYFEGEYRFNITRNGFLGGVLFANAETLTEWPSNNFKTINPGEGLGLRLKINKHSDTNLCIDYGFGSNGSGGFYFNIGEVF